jgi:hypothetical protein
MCVSILRTKLRGSRQLCPASLRHRRTPPFGSFMSVLRIPVDLRLWSNDLTTSRHFRLVIV